jgi:hypothetical protein
VHVAGVSAGDGVMAAGLAGWHCAAAVVTWGMWHAAACLWRQLQLWDARIGACCSHTHAPCMCKRLLHLWLELAGGVATDMLCISTSMYRIVVQVISIEVLLHTRAWCAHGCVGRVVWHVCSISIWRLSITS